MISRAFREASLKRKLTAIMMLTSSAALLVAAASLFINDMVTIRRAMVADLRTLGRIIGANCTAALTFDDAKSAGETLAALRARPPVVFACIYGKDGAVFATYRRPDWPAAYKPPAPGAEGVRVEGGYLTLFQPVVLDAEPIGTLFVMKDSSELSAHLSQYLGIVILIMLASLLVALLLGSRLQALVSRPILDLAQTVRIVSAEENYAIRAAKHSHDEIGVLIDRFNEMLAQIEKREAALKEVNEQLFHSEQRALAANQAKSQFLANMSHELRTPMNAIIGYSEMLLEDTEGQGRERFLSDLRRVHTAGQELLALVNNILDPTAIEATPNTIDLGAFRSRIGHELRTPLNHVIGYCEMLAEEAEESGQTELLPDLGRIHAAAEKLLGLIGDILAFSLVEAGRADPDMAASSVSSMIRDVMATIRTLEDEEAAAPRAEQGLLLVVDDNEMNRDMLSRRLERQGHTVVVAPDGREALQRLAERPFDLVLLDIMMPEMNGLQVLERLKADAGLRHIPVIMISALDELDSVVRCIELGADDYLSKPFNPVLLKARIGACLEKKRLRDREVLHLRQIEIEKQRADDLLHVILPGEIVAELKSSDGVRPRRYENVAVLFCDIVGFTPFCENRQPEEVIAHLQQLVEVYEDLVLRHGMQKIKTIGDAFMATAGLLQPLADPVLTSVRCGLEMIATARQLPAKWDVRVGIHFGPVMAGVVGHRQYLFDLWGDTVNTAARVESHGTSGSVNVSAAAWEQVSACCHGESLGLTIVKGKGSMELFRVDGLREGQRDIIS